MDREKVIKGLECCNYYGFHEDCPYDKKDPNEGQDTTCMMDLMRDALELLKEQQEKIDRLLEESASNAEMADGLKELLKEQEETINDLTETIRQLNQHIKDLSEYMTPYGKVKDVKAYAELLKEQEAKQVIRKQCKKEHDDGSIDYFAEWYCPHCNSLILRGFDNPSIKFCYKCGKPVLWEGR